MCKHVDQPPPSPSPRSPSPAQAHREMRTRPDGHLGSTFWLLPRETRVAEGMDPKPEPDDGDI
ncbi:hypothetical protein E4U54_007075 [Claviceps lovelessii]|nr:hypothetical protein E4U54_007075 [Claviceps lovelessii]